MPAPRSHCSAPHRSASATCPRPSLVARSQRRPVWRQRGQRPAGPPRPSSCWNRRGSTGSSPLCTSCVPREMGDPAQPRGRWPSRKRFPWRSETPPSARRQARASRPDSSAWCRCGCTPTRRSPSGLPARLSRPAPRDPWPRDPATCPARCPASPPARSRSLAHIPQSLPMGARPLPTTDFTNWPKNGSSDSISISATTTEMRSNPQTEASWRSSSNSSGQRTASQILANVSGIKSSASIMSTKRYIFTCLAKPARSERRGRRPV
mmetsp:Transcript_115092/g.325211  ORF Transcript_115092/g.325211 Transcript_115092/m.325211 type:complete len:265 (-) Transcript_115092:423-1217(-)